MVSKTGKTRAWAENSMRILQLVTRSEAGGAQSIVRTLANELSARGHTIAIASGPEGAGEAWQGLASKIERIVIPSLVRSVHPFHDMHALFEITQIYRDWRPDIVHLHTSKAAALGRLAPGHRVPAMVYTMHGYDQLAIANRSFLTVDKMLKHKCGAVVAVSQHDLEHMRQDGYKPIYIPNAVPDNRSFGETQSPILKIIEQLKSNGKLIALVIARNAPPKRIDILRDAARFIDTKLHILWIGGTSNPDDPPNFTALGAIPNAATFLRYTDTYVLASDHEGMPVSILEAFSAGLPVVSSSVGGIPELMGLPSTSRQSTEILETPCGFLVQNNPENFAEALNNLVRDPQKRAQMAHTARLTWERKYSATLMTERYERLYNELIRS